MIDLGVIVLGAAVSGLVVYGRGFAVITFVLVLGTLVAFDRHFNLLLHGAEERSGEGRPMGPTLVRGDSVVAVCKLPG